MGKNANRKPRPAIPRYAWLDRDGCWFCKNKRGCNNCKVNKDIAAAQKKKQDRESWSKEKKDY